MLRDLLEKFAENQSTELLMQIYTYHGKKGFNLACKVAGITRRKGKRKINIYDPAGELVQISKNLGY